MKNEDCDFVAYEKLVDLAKINNLNLEIHSIDSFRNGLLEECKEEHDGKTEDFFTELHDGYHPDKIEFKIMMDFINSPACWCGKCNIE